MRSITDQDYDQLLRDVNYELEDIALEKQSKEQKRLKKLYGVNDIEKEDEFLAVERRGERMAEAYEKRFRKKVIGWMGKEVASIDSNHQKMSYQAIKRNGIRLVE